MAQDFQAFSISLFEGELLSSQPRQDDDLHPEKESLCRVKE